MIRHVSLLLFVATATAIAGCRAYPTDPSSSSALLRDTEEPPCADTVYVDTTKSGGGQSGARNTELGGSESSETCHVVIIYY